MGRKGRVTRATKKTTCTHAHTHTRTHAHTRARRAGTAVNHNLVGLAWASKELGRINCQRGVREGWGVRGGLPSLNRTVETRRTQAHIKHLSVNLKIGYK